LLILNTTNPNRSKLEAKTNRADRHKCIELEIL